MKLKTIFEKPVDRPIEGVIKADDEAGLWLEVEEYVLTNEVEKRLESFLDAYNNYQGANGAWISGFFGSGKSHLLKILSLILENREIEGTKVLDLFLPKCRDNEILKGDLKRAAFIPSKSILFNIDQKADVISKTQIDALLAVFVKVFDESCGYYGKQPYIAQFERELDQDNLFEKFKQEFKKISSYDWEWGRMRAKRVAADIDKAYKAVTAQDVFNILDKYRSDYRLSIEDFAEQVNSYIEDQEIKDQDNKDQVNKNQDNKNRTNDFRLNFFVDEVGQYVADNVKLMTNLQTVAESLATKSRGKAWIVVTAQEDMNTVVGEMDKQQANDFSKIQARFANRLKLTSADVAEVIQKRLLQKNEQGISQLSGVYEDQKNNFKTLFDFTDGSQLYRNFQDHEHFIHAYPFIPYQFTLFQSAIRNLSMHNAFEGKHRSVGERSMLGVFQQVAIQISDHNIGQLATFDLMFEGIRTALKAQIQRSVLIAEQHLDNNFAKQVLKALFLVKYIKEFKPTLRNLSVLMLDEFGKDMDRLNTDLVEALNLLEQQTYIQRNGELFEFLTDEEKDIEQEIKNTEIETEKLAELLLKIIFDTIIKNKKIRYEDNNQDYPFSRKLDDHISGREYELAIHVISPFHEHADNEQILNMQSAGRDELLVIMPPDERMVRDLLIFEKTKKYVQQSISASHQESVKKILNNKAAQNQERLSDLSRHIQNLLTRSKMYVNTSIVDAGGEDPQKRIIKGFHDLISGTYPNLKMLLGFNYTEDYISKCLKQNKDTLFGNKASMLSEAEQEMLSFIQNNKNSGVRTSLKTLIERFERKSYGWYYAAILSILAKLCAAEKVEVSSDSNIYEIDQLEKALRNSHAHANLLLEPLTDFTAAQIRNLKTFYADFFDAQPSAKEAKALGRETISAFNDLIENLTALTSEKSKYPFLTVLDKSLEKLKEFQGKSYSYYLTDLHKAEDELLDLKEDVIDPVQRFMNGAVKKIYDDAAIFLNNQEFNFNNIKGNEHKQILEILQDKDCCKGNRMQQVKALLDSVSIKIDNALKQTRQDAAGSVNSLLNKMTGMDDFAKLSQEKQDELKIPFKAFIRNIEEQTLIAVIRDNLRRFEEDDFQKLLTKMSAQAQPEPNPKPKIPLDFDIVSGKKDENTISEPQYIAASSIKPLFDKTCLEDQNDIEQYLKSLEKAMNKEILQGRRIRI
ncbi:BREX system P-loop protein BrxC [Desulfobacterales bacterium HSG17]|nr:BREX system P-loop protein BrxC [Desulfobacterales bacterium HSG17]